MYAGQPKDVEGYSKTETDGLTVYVPEDVPVRQEGLSIKLIGFGPFRQLVVDGFRI